MRRVTASPLGLCMPILEEDVRGLFKSANRTDSIASRDAALKADGRVGLHQAQPYKLAGRNDPRTRCGEPTCGSGDIRRSRFSQELRARRLRQFANPPINTAEAFQPLCSDRGWTRPSRCR